MFLRAVKLYNSGDFRSSTEDMERALAEYLAVFARCLAGCEGAHEQVDFKDFYPAIAGTAQPLQPPVGVHLIHGALLPRTPKASSHRYPSHTLMKHPASSWEVGRSKVG